MKKNNKGFSLVEIVVVVAIMAILVAMLAPQYLRYVERSRLQKDNQEISEVANAVKIAGTYNEIYRKLTGAEKYISNSGPGNKTITFTGKNACCPELDEEMDIMIGTQGITTQSSTYQKLSTPIEISIEKGSKGLLVHVSGWVHEISDSPAPTTRTF